MNIAKVFNNSFFYRSPPVATLGYSNQSKIFREISDQKPPRVFFCERLEQLLSKMILGGLLMKRKPRKRRLRSHPCGFSFQGIHLLSHEAIFFFNKFSHTVNIPPGNLPRIIFMSVLQCHQSINNNVTKSTYVN